MLIGNYLGEFLWKLQHGQRLLRFRWRKFSIHFGQILFSQFDLACLRIIADVSFVTRFRNGDNAGLPEHPRKRDLGRGAAVTLGNFLEGRVFQQAATMADGRIRHQGRLMVGPRLNGVCWLLMERQEARFDFAILQIIEDLISGAGRTVFDRE
jgi:hypothetical protein